MSLPKRRTAMQRKLARQAANAKYYQRNREAITDHRRKKYQEDQIEAIKAKLKRRGKETKTKTPPEPCVATARAHSTGSKDSSSSSTSIKVTTTSGKGASSVTTHPISRFSNHLQANLNQARNIYREFRSTFRRQSRREFFIGLHDRYDDSVEERENLNVLVMKLARLTNRMNVYSSQMRMHAGKDRESIIEVDEVEGYVRTMASWVKWMNAFDYWASWGKESLTTELHGSEGNLRHLISYFINET